MAKSLGELIFKVFLFLYYYKFFVPYTISTHYRPVQAMLVLNKTWRHCDVTGIHDHYNKSLEYLIAIRETTN